VQHLQLKHCAFAALTLHELYEVLWLRNLVFVCGQKITAEPEVDGLDPECVHVLGYLEGQLVVTARLFMDQHPIKMGRIAVHPNWQGRGLGTQMMDYIHDLIGDQPAAMSAQAHLRPWYSRLGWQAVGDLYDEAGIPHIWMVRGRSKPES
jgi:ElaA protein